MMVLLAVPTLIIGRNVKKLSRESQDHIADTSALTGEILNAMPTVQAYTQVILKPGALPSARKSVSLPQSSNQDWWKPFHSVFCTSSASQKSMPMHAAHVRLRTGGRAHERGSKT